MNNFLNGPKRFQDNPNKVYILRKNGTEFFGFDQDGEPVVISAEALFQVANIEGAVSTQSIENIEPRVTELDGKVSDHQVRINDLTGVTVVLSGRVDAHDLLIASLASGSPKGTYPTLGDLAVAFPSGDPGIYVVSGDGHWYYWSGSAWTDGGAYLVSEISDGTKTYSKEEAIRWVDGEPLYAINLSEV